MIPMSRLGADPNIPMKVLHGRWQMDVCRSSVTCRKSWRQKVKRRTTVFFCCWHIMSTNTIVFICYRFVVDGVIWPWGAAIASIAATTWRGDKTFRGELQWLQPDRSLLKLRDVVRELKANLKVCHRVAQVNNEGTFPQSVDLIDPCDPCDPCFIVFFFLSSCDLVWFDVSRRLPKTPVRQQLWRWIFFLGCAQSWRHAKGFRPHNSLPLVNVDNSNWFNPAHSSWHFNTTRSPMTELNQKIKHFGGHAIELSHVIWLNYMAPQIFNWLIINWIWVDPSHTSEFVSARLTMSKLLVQNLYSFHLLMSSVGRLSGSICPPLQDGNLVDLLPLALFPDVWKIRPFHISSSVWLTTPNLFVIKSFHPISSLLAGWDHPTESKSSWRGAERIGDSTLREGLHLRSLLSKLSCESVVFIRSLGGAGITLLIAG